MEEKIFLIFFFPPLLVALATMRLQFIAFASVVGQGTADGNRVHQQGQEDCDLANNYF